MATTKTIKKAAVEAQTNTADIWDTERVMKELEIQRRMGAISLQTIIDKSPYTIDTATETKRIEEEQSKGIYTGVLIPKQPQTTNIGTLA